MTNSSGQLSAATRPLRLGIFGGGQLAGMMLPYAQRLGAESWVMDAPGSPASALCQRFVEGDVTNAAQVVAFGMECDVITVEIEKVSAAGLAELEKRGKLVFPSASVVAVVQDKGAQKQFFRDQGVPTADFLLTESAAELAEHVEFLPAVHKLRRGGYDGRGVTMLGSREDLGKAFDAPSVLEKRVDMAMEISVIVARGRSGETRTYAPVEMVFDPRLNLLDYLIAPADLPAALADSAAAIAAQVAQALNVVGLLAVEMFVTKTGQLLVNEIAPRPHNSGHHTIEAAATSQFEQHLRAVLGMTLGEVRQEGFALMRNIVGEAQATGPALLLGKAEAQAISGVYVHDYGKLEVRPGRKMGHVTVVGASRAEVEAKASRVKALVRATAGKEERSI